LTITLINTLLGTKEERIGNFRFITKKLKGFLKAYKKQKTVIKIKK